MHMAKQLLRSGFKRILKITVLKNEVYHLSNKARFCTVANDNNLAKEKERVLQEELYREHRLQEFRTHNMKLEDLYPHKFSTNTNITEFVNRFRDRLSPGEVFEDEIYSVAGRVLKTRVSGKKIYFVDISNGPDRLQVKLEYSRYKNQGSFASDAKLLSRGDIIGVVGRPGRTRSGELSVFAEQVSILSPCLTLLPGDEGPVKQELKRRSRHLDTMLNKKSHEVFLRRAAAVSAIRSFLDGRGFLEVETPVAGLVAGGAAARPFETYNAELGMEMYLRVAPELHLKTLLVGGYERVYEIGKQFRNEGIDRQHNPEFTTCEFYASYLDYLDLLDITEKLLRDVSLDVLGSDSVKYGGRDGLPEVEVCFAPPFARVDYLSRLSMKLGMDLNSKVSDLDAERETLLWACSEYGVECAEPKSTARLLDKLFGHLVEPELIQPTFVMNHPICLSPLAKEHRSKPGLCERFELFVGGQELCNAYTELNNPYEQQKRFEQEQLAREGGDNEAMQPDAEYIKTLLCGLPPCAGWGMGIDRLIMILTNSSSIKDVIFFPVLKKKS